MGSVYRRTPKNYDGIKSPSHHLRDLLPGMLRGVGAVHEERPDLVVKAWPELIGPSLSSMTQAISFVDGILTVKVGNSTLYSLLNQHEKQKLVKRLRASFPKIQIKTIFFRMG